MNAAGIILADRAATGEAIRDDLGLTSWYVTSPRSIARGFGRGLIVAPRLLVVSGSDPYGVRDELLPCFGQETPATYWLTGSAL